MQHEEETELSSMPEDHPNGPSAFGPAVAKKSGRAHRKPRCRVCGLHLAMCVCAELPRVELPIGLVVLQHVIEEYRPTNTGRLVHYMFRGSRLIPYGRGGEPLDESPFREPGRRCLLLYPRSGGRVLTRADLLPADGAPVTLVVPDGNWRQASRMAQRTQVLQAMPCMALPPGLAGVWTVRNSQHLARLCTAEAVIRVAEVLGFTAEAVQMLSALATINRKMIGMRPVRPARPAAGESPCVGLAAG